jgi:type IV pilus assembly protein PilN
MRITVNLATRPFVELRPFVLRLRIFMAVLAVVGVGAIIATHVLQQKLDIEKAQIDRVHAQVLAARQEKQVNEQRMRQPANAAVLTRAHFLNTLFLRKSFSWTAVMMDLETVLPAGVQVTSIEPSISGDGNVLIRLRVSGERDRAVQLVRNLERSRRFRAPRLTGEATQAKEGGGQAGNNFGSSNGLAPAGVEFEILADYNPLPEGETYATERPVRALKSVDGAAGPSRKHRTKSDGVVLKPYSATHPKPAAGGAR